MRCRLREFRGRRSLRDIAEQADISAGVLSNIERGRMFPADTQLPGLERAYGRTVDEWYEWRGPMLAVEFEDADDREAA